MRHAGFCQLVLLAKHGVPWDIAYGWSTARRSAALQIIEDSKIRDRDLFAGAF